MVSKSKILGQSALIFVTVGTTSFPFDRLLKALDKILLEIDCKAKLVVQSGKSRYVFKYSKVKRFEYLNPTQLRTYLRRANAIITHAGFGTLFMIAQHSTIKPFVIPRLKKYNEHVDNHQLFFINYNNRSKKLNNIEDNINQQLLNYLTYQNRSTNFCLRIFKLNPNQISLKIHDYIENM